MRKDNKIKLSDIVSDKEASFPFRELLETDYFKKYKSGYYNLKREGFLNQYRNYASLLIYLNEIYGFNEQHAKSFAKRLKSSSNDWNNAEALFSEIIVYRYYIRLVYEGLIKNINMETSESDIIIVRSDNSKAYLEVFCVMPNLPVPEKGKIVVQDIHTHTQNEMSSIRQKLLRKIEKQKQMTKPRDNYAVIELNNSTIAGDFAILSSLSSGYKVSINRETNQVTSSGYDWNDSVFDDESTQYLKGIMYFNLGDYGARKYLMNPKFKE